VTGAESSTVFRDAYLNAVYETGFDNPIDESIRAHGDVDVSACQKLDEVPYDFVRKRLSVLVADGDDARIVTKGALANVLDVCTIAATTDGRVPIEAVRDGIDRRFAAYSDEGYRVLGVASRTVDSPRITKDDEESMTFDGFLVLEDPPKADVDRTIGELAGLGVSTQVITDDNWVVAAHVADRVGLGHATALTGGGIATMSDEALVVTVTDVDVFVEIEPNQKERVIRASQKSNTVVGYMGDGINDALALHTADVGLSVEGAVDVATEAADVVLLENDLGVLERGVRLGRQTSANTLKYVFMATSLLCRIARRESNQPKTAEECSRVRPIS